MGGVIDGTPVDAANTNPKFIFKDSDDVSSGVLGFDSAVSGEGSSVTSTQREHNSAASFMGKALNAVYNVLPSFTNNQGFTTSQSLFAAIDAIRALFHNTTGHKHDGTAGGGAPVPASAISSVPLLGYIIQGTGYTALGADDDVSSLLSGKIPSSSSVSTGVVVNTPYNKVLLRQGSGTSYGDIVEDSLGNEVYGRITYSASVWTVTYYVLLSNVETAYTIPSTDVIWYYQELFNPLFNPPVYSNAFFIPSDNATADVVDASATQRGLVNTTTQTFAGVKTFNSAPNFNSLTASYLLALDGSKNVVIYTPSTSGTRASPTNIVAGTGVVFSGVSLCNYYFIQGSGGAVTVSANPQISAGSYIGQELILTGRSDTNTVTFSDGTGLELNGPYTMVAGSVLALYWDGSLWKEKYRGF